MHTVVGRDMLGQVLAEIITVTEERACPSQQDLATFADRLCPPDVARRIELHLTFCPKCQQVIDALPAGKRLSLDTTRVAPSVTDTSTDDFEGPTQGFNVDEAFDLRLLEAAQEEGSLGRLGSYEILGILGRGGYGVVLKARDTTLRRLVAIKILEQVLAGSATSRRRFIREARAAAGIKDLNVVTIYNVAEHNGVPFLVMELIAGKSLRDWIRATPQRGFLDVLRIGAQIAQGLAAAHAQGVIHRDVKPANIMLEDGVPRVKITDFGLARVAIENVELTSRQLAVGTPAYMAPEQFRGEEVDTRTDLFALGCVLYAMITGHSPFHGRTVVEIANLVGNFQPRNLADEKESVPRFLGDIIARLLEKDPQRRYQSAAEVAEVLNRHLTVLNAAPTDEIPRILREGVRNQKRSSHLGTFAAVALCLVLVAGGVWYVAGNRFGNQSETNPGSSGGTVTQGTGSEAQSTIPAVTRTASVTVAKSAEADFRSIKDALLHVLPGGIVTILDDGEYSEPVVLRDAAAHAGVQLVSKGRAVLRSSQAGPVVRLLDVPGVEISGLKIVATQGQHAVEMTGNAAGSSVHDVEIERIANPDASDGALAAVYVHQGAVGEADRPLRLERLDIRNTVVGIVIGDHSLTDPARFPGHVIVENSRIHGAGADLATLVALIHGSHHVSLRYNLLTDGVCGLSVKTAGQDGPKNWEFSHNTCYRLSSFANWTGPPVEGHDFTMTDNLLVDVRFVADQFLDSATQAGREASFRNNWWVAPTAEVQERLKPLATLVDSLPFLSADPTHADFLKLDVAKLSPALVSNGIAGRQR